MIIYLYVKQHSITGLKYFGKTTSKDPFKYLGSGKRWIRHIKKHGKKLIKTLEVWGFDSQVLCTEFALKFSKENNIVESNEWANLKEENGLDGNPVGFRHTQETKNNQSKLVSGKNNPMYGKTGELSPIFGLGGIFRGKCHSEKTKQLYSLTRSGELNPMYGKNHTEETKHKMRTPKSESHKNKLSILAKSRPKIQCPYCDKIADICNAKRYHFDNCKFKYLS